MLPTTQMAVQRMNWKNTPSPVSNFFTGTKLEPKNATATKAHAKPMPWETIGMEEGGGVRLEWRRETRQIARTGCVCV